MYRFQPSARMKNMLLVDDDPVDRDFIEGSLRENGVADRIFAFQDSGQAIRYLAGEGVYADRDEYPYPSMVITGLRMTTGDGFELLEYLKRDPNYAIIPVLVLSSSDDEDDVKRAYRMGAASYIRKPQELDALRVVLKTFYDYWEMCILPTVDAAGRQYVTEHHGKLGERFGRL
jgi:CheY-like chemotaxis protein